MVGPTPHGPIKANAQVAGIVSREAADPDRIAEVPREPTTMPAG